VVAPLHEGGDVVEVCDRFKPRWVAGVCTCRQTLDDGVAAWIEEERDGPPTKPAVDIEERDARWVLEINVLGVWHGCSVFGRRLIEQGTPAHIVNTGSENSLGVPHTGAALYTASKHAILGLSDVLRRELPDFIGVSVLCPGMVATELSKSGLKRPDRFGGPFERGARTGVQPGLDPDEVGRRTVEGIKRGDFYIVTHPPVVELAEERWKEISAAFAEQAPRFDGDEVLDTRVFLRRLQAGESEGL
jgi:NAD(P)-dependent dehydrogenase (short-subunit alcohol dehydrogenase family)